MAHISVVIPVYKAEGCLRELYQRLKAVLELISKDFEIVLVEDCGGDRSWEIIQALAQEDSRVKGIQFSRNFGQHYGITAGLDHCHGDWIVVMDCDLQDRPEEIPRLYARAQEGYDVVLARRRKRQDAIGKRLTSWLFYKTFNYLADVKYDAQVGNFRILSRNVIQNFCLMREQLRFFGGLVDWMGFPTASIEVEHNSRFEGKSTYTFAKLWKLAIDTILAYSDKPLRLSIKFGFAISCFAFIYGSYIFLWAVVHGSTVTGWSSLIVSIYFLSGVIISVLGIIGVYLGKTFDESKKRPLYVIRNATFDQQQVSQKLTDIVEPSAPISSISSHQLTANSSDYLLSTPWDAVTFAIDTFEIKTSSQQALQQIIADHKLGHYTLKVDPLTCKQSLHDLGFYYCDTLIEPHCTPENFNYFKKAGCSISRTAPIASLIEICKNSFTYGRFHRDFNIDHNLAETRYISWLKDLYASGDVLCLMYQDDLAGFWGVSQHKILLHALDKSYRGQGMAKYFWSLACQELFDQGHRELTSSISTANAPVLNLYTSLGFRFRNPVDVYHLLIQE